MSELQLKRDEYSLFVALPECGDPAGNSSTRTSLGWSKARYMRAREGLLDKQLVIKAHGRGGALRRAPVTEDAAVDDAGRGQVTIRPPVPEFDLYKPILTTLRDEWADERGFQPLVIEDTARQGRRRTGGAWTRPDLVAIGLKSFRHIPQQQFEIVTFEVKPMRNANVVAVFEALAHRRASTHAYILVEVRDELANAYRSTLADAEAVARDHGIGVITFDNPADFETWDEVVPAQRCDSPPEAMNDFIETQVSQAGQLVIAEAVAAMR